MSIVDAVVKEIMGMVELDELPMGQDFGYFDDSGIVISGSEAERIRRMRPHPEEVMAEGEDVLGTYHPMSSPGLITLHKDDLGSFFWHTVLEINQKGYFMSKKEIERMAYVCVLKTYYHEQFHHLSDVCRHLFSSTSDQDIEEALAVASSYIRLNELKKQWNSKIGMLYDSLFIELMKKIYRYSSPGYRDWVNYRSEYVFLGGITDYLGPASSPFLEKSRINVGGIIMAIQKEVGGSAIERVV